MADDSSEKAAIEARLAELEAWARIAASTDIADFQAFLKKWPAGAYAADAKARITKLDISSFWRRALFFGAAVICLAGVAIDVISSGNEQPGSWIWRQLHDKSARTLTGHTRTIDSVAFSPDGRTLASGSWDQTIKLWEITSGRELRTLTGHTNAVDSVAFSPDGGMLASGSWDGTIRLWDAASGRELRVLGHKGSGYSGRTLASGSSDNTIKLWDVSPYLAAR
jgi:predicted NACHT family NTPase